MTRLEVQSALLRVAERLDAMQQALTELRVELSEFVAEPEREKGSG